MISPYSHFIKLCDTTDNVNEIKSYYNKNKGIINLSKYNCYIFRFICEQNKLGILKWLYPLCDWKIQIEIDDDETEKGFYYCCRKGYTRIVKYIYSIEHDLDYNDTFCLLCQYGHLDLAKWIYSIHNISINIHDNFAFREAVDNNHFK